ncbi:hypothetical protein MFRU_005g00290 [Monilinia fructicola]|nr:hypothetical protein MFRU_005g00290 [Monilinia fructicola]
MSHQQEKEQPTADMDLQQVGFLWPITVIALLSTPFLFAANTTMVADIQSIIIKNFGEVNKLPWISVSYELAALSVNYVQDHNKVLVFKCQSFNKGKLHGQLDSKYLFIAAVLIFSKLATWYVAQLKTWIQRYPVWVVEELMSAPGERPLYMRFIGGVWCVGTVVSWRWGFYINLCIAAASAPAYIFAFPSSKSKPVTSIMTCVRNIDFLESVLFMGAACFIIMAISWQYHRALRLLWCPLDLILDTAVLLFLTTAEYRFFPLQFIKSIEMSILFIQVAAGSAATLVLVFFIPLTLFFQFVKRDSALSLGVRVLSFIGGLVVGLLVNGGLMGPIGIYSPWFTTGRILVIIGGALLQTITIDTDTARIYGFSAILEFGAGLFVRAPFANAQAKVQASELADVSSFITCGQLSGIVFSLSISNSIFINLSTQSISEIREARFNLSSLALLDKTAVLTILVHNIDRKYSMLIAAGTLVTFFSIFLKRERLDLQIKAHAIAD